MNTPGIPLSGDCTPWYVDVSCPPYSVTTAMTAEDQRKGIQQAWDDVSAAGGGVVVLPEMYTVDRKQGTFYCLLARDNVATWGVDQLSSGLSMVHDDAGALMLVATGPVNSPGSAVNVSFNRLTLDGNKANFVPVADLIPQRHCLWLQEAANVLCDQVRFSNALMDGAYHHDDTHETTFRDCLFVGSGRNGITFTRAGHNVKISRCRFRDIVAQQIDSEPIQAFVPFDILVESCTFERASGPRKFVVSVAGHSADENDRTHNWRFIGNRFEGSVVVTWARNIVFSGNEWVITDETYQRPCLFLNRATEHVTVTGNTFESTVDCIRLQATSSARQQPRHITIDGNTFILLPRRIQNTSRYTVNASAGPGEYVFSNNTVLGPPDGQVVALYHRATRRNKSAIIRGNIVRQCKVGFQLVSAATNRFERVVLDGNTFDPGPLPSSFALVLDRKENVIDDFVMANNIWAGVGVVPVARLLEDEVFVPYDGSQLWRTDGNAGIQATYSCLGSPIGQFDAPIGSLAVRRDGGIGTSLYVKEADTQAGWNAK
jgi:polygalacturonase